MECNDKNNQADAQMVAAFQNGDVGIFDQLVLKYQDIVYSLCYRFMGEAEEADDLAQETFVKVFRSLKKFRREAAFSTWLYQIAANTCKSRLGSLAFRFRKKLVRIEALKTEADLAQDIPRFELPDPRPGPAQALEENERDAIVQKAINRLPPDQKTVIILSDIEGLAYDEIVKITGFKLGTVKSKIARARSQLAIMLKGKIYA
ncbi:MAG: sigma-70 family RNA polymerase sigma factor [Candidatus Margulisiibacteriota bacterium]